MADNYFEDFDDIYNKYNYELMKEINSNPPFSIYEIDIYDSEDIIGSKDLELGLEKNIVTLYDARLFEKVKKGYRKRSLNVLKNSNAEDLMFLGLFYKNSYKIKILDEKKENIYIIDAAALSADEIISLEELEKNIKEDKWG